MVSVTKLGGMARVGTAMTQECFDSEIRFGSGTMGFQM